MSTISVTLPSDGTAADAADINNPINTIVTAINGNLDSTNIKSAGVSTANIATSAVTADKLATNTICLGYAQITTSYVGSTTISAVTGLSVTVTIPAGGRRVKITVQARDAFVGGTGGIFDITLWDGTVGTGTQLQAVEPNLSSGIAVPISLVWVSSTAPTAGSKTYNVGIKGATNNPQIDAATTAPAFILVEMI